jgi:glycosyltransferase involved in cell wall biosynthesis
MKKNLKVKIVYRNYKPLHMIYKSLTDNPPEGVTYIVPKTIGGLSRFMFIYRKYKHNLIVRRVIGLVNRFVFSSTEKSDDVDVLHFINMSSSNPNSINKPYIVDVERATSLTGFSKGKENVAAALNFLEHENCKAIVCMSEASKKTLIELAGDKWDRISQKVEVIYPTIPVPDSKKPDHSIIKKNSKLKLLFVGNQSGRKGLPDLVESIRILNGKYLSQVELYVVSSDAKPLLDQYDLPNVHLFPPQYTKDQMLKSFFLPSDLFVFPTRGDTYGLVVVDSLAAGTPVMATNQFAIKELVEHNKDGLLLDFDNAPLDTYTFLPKKVVSEINSNIVYPKTVKQIAKHLERIINNKSSLDFMAKNTRKKFKYPGKLSIEHRNAQYLNIYRRIV